MTTWTHSPNEVASEWKSMFDEDLISPYGDFNASTDVTKFWDMSLDSVTTELIASVTIDSGTLKILGDATSDNHIYTKAIPVVTGRSYTISGSTTAASDTTQISGGSTSGSTDYFVILIGASGLPDTFAEDHAAYGTGSLTFTATSDTFYLQFLTSVGSGYYVSGDNISLSGPTPNVSIDATWNTLKGGVWDLGSLVDWEDLDKHNWEDWN